MKKASIQYLNWRFFIWNTHFNISTLQHFNSIHYNHFFSRINHASNGLLLLDSMLN
jgi:hypothetical protein